LSETFFDKTYIFRNIQGFRPFLYTPYIVEQAPHWCGPSMYKERPGRDHDPSRTYYIGGEGCTARAQSYFVCENMSRRVSQSQDPIFFKGISLYILYYLSTGHRHIQYCLYLRWNIQHRAESNVRFRFESCPSIVREESISELNRIKSYFFFRVCADILTIFIYKMDCVINYYSLWKRSFMDLLFIKKLNKKYLS